MTTPSTEIAGVGAQPVPSEARPLRPVQKLVYGYRWLARRELLACVAILVLTLGIRAALLPWIPVPQPVIHDEFSYLLAGDMYAHGRLAYPTHPFWQHFETFHVLQHPTYASKYQPLQGMVLAFGQKVFGEPWVGVYLSTGLMCAAICWMLQGWIAPEWALLGALCCVLRVGVLSYWMNSYLAGSVPGIGGALALGAAVRIWRKRQFGHSVTWAVGLTILALSRPYDAAVVACASAALLLWFLFRSHTPLATIGRRVALPASLVLLLCGGFIAYNDYRVTGSPLTLPYMAHDGQYAMASMFTMMPLRPEPPYRHAIMRKFWAVWNVGERTDARTDPVGTMLVKLYIVANFFFPFLFLVIPVLLCPYRMKTGEEGAAFLLLVVCVLMFTPLISMQAHYAAAFAGVFYLCFLYSLRRLWWWRPEKVPVGPVLGIVLVALLAGDGLGLTSAHDLLSGGIALRTAKFWPARRSIIQSLEQQPGRHLILVRYAPEHDPQIEWVYNGADVDASRIVWAREMTPEQDRPFLEYFHDRQVWLLEPDRSPLKLQPLPIWSKGSHDGSAAFDQNRPEQVLR